MYFGKPLIDFIVLGTLDKCDDICCFIHKHQWNSGGNIWEFVKRYLNSQKVGLKVFVFCSEHLKLHEI